MNDVSPDAEAGCLKSCYGASNCVVGWPDGSCGARPQGTREPPQEPYVKPDEAIFVADENGKGK